MKKWKTDRAGMAGLFLSVLLLAAGGCSSPAQAEGADAGSLLSKVTEKYKALETYSSSGTIVSHVEMNGNKVDTTTTFSIKLKKPNLYLISWNQSDAVPQNGAVWSDGTQPYLYMGVTNAYSKIGDDASALGAATGISGGAAFTIPSILLPALGDKGVVLSRLKNPMIEKAEMVNGEDCDVLSGSSDASKKESFWISKSSSLILKYERSFEPPAGGVVIPAISDQDLEKALRATGQPVNDASKKQMRDMMANAEDTLKKGGMSGLSTETLTDISTPALTENDFHFTPPSGTVLKDSVLAPQTGFSQPRKVSGPAGAGAASSSNETVQASVEQVFSANDGNDKFIAYLVKWKGFDVVVSDPLARSHLKVGDTVKFLAQKIQGANYSTLSFTML